MEKSIIFDNGRLICVGQEHTRIPAVLARLHGSQVRQLDLSYNRLVTLQGTDMFPQLQELIVDNNCITENVSIPSLPTLITLSANKNKIQNLEVFVKKIAAALPNLRYLSLLGNTVCPDQLSDRAQDEDDYARYRCFVLHHLPKLAFLDSSNVRAEEVIEAKRRGHLMKVAKPLLQSAMDTDDSSSHVDDEGLSPLPLSRRNIDDHQGAYGKCRYKYSGKNSEGNRFIRNNDL